MKNSAVVLLFSLCVAAQTSAPSTPSVDQLHKMSARFAPTALKVETSALSKGDKAALARLIEAARIVDSIQLEQRWSGNSALRAKLARDKSPLGAARFHYFWINKGPWSIIDDNTPFIPGVPARPLGANFYPDNMTKAEFEAWVKTLSSDQREQAESFFTVIHRGADKKLTIVPYSEEYKSQLAKLAELVRAAAGLTDNASLKKFLQLRADAFLSNNYFDSDVAWMDLNAPVDITIGPYETYNDGIFGYKADFEAFVNVRDEKESAKLAFLSGHLQTIENNLPIPAEFRNPKLGALSPIVVVNEVFGAGDGNQGIQNVAYNLPNDERVVQQKGSKRVMLKNIQRAKFDQILLPISKLLLAPSALGDLDFDTFFTHTVAHELTHGLGPHVIKVKGRETNPRVELKELYSGIEEAKADVTGLFALQFLMDKHLLRDSLGEGQAAERKLYNTYLASSFRTLHFGLTDAHARGMAIQFNFLRDKGAYVLQDGKYAVDFSKIKQAVKDLDHELLMLEATGDYSKTKQMISELGVIRPEVQSALDRLQAVPTDIQPIFTTADAIAPTGRHAKQNSSPKTRGK